MIQSNILLTDIVIPTVDNLIVTDVPDEVTVKDSDIISTTLTVTLLNSEFIQHESQNNPSLLDLNTTEFNNLSNEIVVTPTIQNNGMLLNTDIPVYDNAVPTDLSLNTNSPSNNDVLGSYESVNAIPSITPGSGSLFPSDPTLLPQINSLFELLQYLSEVMMRFNSDPNYYMQDDFAILVKTITNALIHLYLNAPLSTGEVEGLYAALGTKVDKILGKGLSTNDLTDELKAAYDSAFLETHLHSNKAALDLVSGKNTGDQDLSVLQPKETGKGLSTNDFTNTYKNKLDGIQTGAEANVNADWNATSGDTLILNKPNIPSITGLATETYVQNYAEPKKGTDDNYVTDSEKTNLHAPHSDDQDLSGLVVKIPGYSLVLNVDIAKIHVAHSDDQDLTPYETIANNNIKLATKEPANANIQAHITNTNNPHFTTKAQIGLSQVDNTRDIDKPISILTQLALNTKEPNITSGLITDYWRGDKTFQPLNKAAVGLDNVDNTSDLLKPISTATQSALDLKLDVSLKGANNGLAELDSNGFVKNSQLPSYVDDVLEYTSISLFPTVGESGKIYIDTTTNLTYRWGGTTYAIISSSLALGETSATAYRGDRGKIAYDHSQINSGNPHGLTLLDIGAQAQLNGTGLVRMSGTSITYDNTSYVSGTPWTSVGYWYSGSHPTTTSGYGLPDYPTTLPASDVYSWAKASTKPSYAYSEITSKPTLLSQFTNDLGNYGSFVTGTPWTGYGYLTGITGTQVTTALGYTPYNSTNPSGYISSITKSQVEGVLTGLITTHTHNYLSSFTETDPIFIAWNKSTGISITKSQVSDFPTNLSQFNNNLGNYGGWITGINSGMVTTALGYTPLPTRTFGSAASSNTGDFVSSSGTLGSSITLGTVYNGTANQSVPTNLLGGYSNGYVYNFTQNQIQSWLGLGSSAYTNNNDHILNQNSSAQSANMWISGDVTAYGKGKFGVTYHSVELRALDSDYGSAMYLYADGGTDQRVYRIANKYSGSGTDLVIDYSDARAYNTEAIAHTYTERFRLSKTGAVTFTSTVNATQLQSTVATGTAPLTVNSTTMVGNLNAEMVNGLKYYGADFASTVSYVMVYDAPNARMSPATSTQIRNFIGVNNIATQDLSSLSTNYIPKWNGSNFVNSLISDDGTNASARGDYFAINIPSNNYSGKLKFGSGSSFDYFISSGDNYGSMIFNSVGQWGNKAFTFNYATTPLLTIESNGVVSIPNTTQSLSPSTGALVLNGGMGINGRLSLPSGSGWVGMLSFDHNVSNGSSRKWFIHTDYQSYGDFAITTQSTQSANTVPDIGRFYISPNGNTGIGYISDQGYKLAVNGTLMATGTVNTYAGEGIKMIADAAYLSGYNSANTVRQGYLQFTGNAVYISAESGTGDIALINKSAVLIRNDVGGEARIQLQGSQAGVKQYYIKNSIQGISNTGFSIRNASDGTTPFYIDGSDNSHFNGNVTASNFISNGNVIAAGEIVAYSASDERLKENIQPLNNSLDVINKLNPVQYNWNEKAKELNPNKDEKTDVGVIAQQLKEVLPNLVHNIYNDEFLSVDYIKLIPYLIGAIQELTQEINTLKNK